MKTTDNKKKYQRKFWILPIVLLSVAIGTEFWYRNSVYEGSLPIIISWQKSFNNTFTSATSKSVMFEIIRVLSTNLTYFVISILTYNFVNVYKSFVLISSIFLSNYLCSVLCFIYRSPRPYMVTSKIVPLFAFNDWGNPNTQLATWLTFFLTWHKVIFKAKNTRDKLWLRIVLGVVFSIITLFIYFMHWVAGIVSFNQIIMSSVIGVVTYLIIFTICQAKMNNPKQFYSFVNFSFLYYVAWNIIMFTFVFILYRFITNDEETIFYMNTIKIQVDKIDNIILPNDYHESFFLHRGNFNNVISFFMNIIAILAWKAELYITYEKNFETWKKNNFEMKDKISNGLIDVSIWTDYKYIKGTQWNHTGIPITIIRFFCLVWLSFLSYLPTIFTMKKIDNIFWDSFILVFLPYTILVFGMFYGFKFILRKIKLANSDV